MPRFVHLFLVLLAPVASWPQTVVAAEPAPDREFTVMAYNAEMLFDVDGEAAINDYAPSNWGPAQLDRKLAGISRVLQRLPGSRGPDVICFNELEADRTPESTVAVDTFLARHADTTAHALLTVPTLAPDLAGVPVQAWLAKRLADDGMTGYHVVVGRWREDPTGHLVFHTNAVFSRFPIVATTTHDTNGARGIIEVQLDMGTGHPLYVFDNHWKSGAGDPNLEPVRVGNAKVLRARLDEILRADPQADVIFAGDFNSQYNQKQRYPQMKRTAINDVLGSQGDETAMLRPRGPVLYNLWFELPNEQRGSDEFRGEWGTLMQILITRGLYDARGVQYVDNSFTVAAFPGLNADPDTGRPVRWSFVDGGRGFSDHLPVFARFRAGPDLMPLELEHPSRTADGPSAANPVRLSLENAINLGAWPVDREFRTAENLGRFFHVEGRVTSDRPFRITVDGPGTEIVIWIRDRELRESYFARHPVGDHVSFFAELGQYRGDWQFVIPESEAQ